MLRFVTRSIAAILVCSSVAVFAEDAAAVQKQIAEKMGTIKSLRAKMVSKMDNSGPQYKMVQESQGTYEYVKKDDKTFLYRMESKGKMSMEAAGQKQPDQESDTLAICDGTFAYNYDATRKMATKTKLQMPDPTNVETANKDFDVKVMPDEKVDGQDCWVLEMTPKAGTPQAAMGGKMLNYYRKDCGWTVKSVTLNAEGKPTTTSEYKDLEVNPSIEPSRFVFTAPPGVTVQEVGNG